MGWKRKIGIGCLGLLLLLAAAAGFMWYRMTSSAPQITVSAPRETGLRIDDNGLPANWYPARGKGPHPAILLLGGSEGGLWDSTDQLAQRWQDKGFSVLYQSYYRTSEANATFTMVPLETFDAALAWIARQSDVDPARIGIVGGSKGAEAALLVASEHPEVHAVVAAMPSSVVWQGFAWGTIDMSDLKSSWSRAGEPVPYLPYGAFEFGKPLATMYANSFTALGEHEDAVIRVEAIAGPVLLICGEKDKLWPSCPMAAQIAARAKSKAGPDVSVLRYPQGGHGIFGLATPDPKDGESQYGGTYTANNAARRDNLPKIESFLQAALKPGT